MRYEWDAAKEASNRAKHGVAFALIEGFDWSSAVVRADMRAGDPEGRLVAFGQIGGRVFQAVFVIRRRVRLISLRKANNEEIDFYEAEAAQEHF